MDPVTQGALGAAWAQPAGRGARIAWATVIGAVAGMAPDLDILIRSEADPLLAVEFHRHFTHSLFFVPFGALVCAAAMYVFARRTLGFGACYAFSFLGFLSHGLLDACTSYGTLLLWPFSRERIAWDLVSVIDPLFTVPLIVCVLVSLKRRQAAFAMLGFVWCLAYLGFGGLQNQRAVAAATARAFDRGHTPTSVEAKPSFANLLLWRTIYRFDGRYYVDAVRASLAAEVIDGASIPVFDQSRDAPWLAAESVQAEDVERFRWFAQGYLAYSPEIPQRIIDLRYSLVPNRADGLWAIELDPAAGPEQHAAYVTMRVRSMEEGRELLDMLFH